MNDVLVNKIQSIQRCVERAREVYAKKQAVFLEDYDAQDAAALNILRACEQAIALANHVLRLYKMGVPTSSSESFELLLRKHVINTEQFQRLKGMVGFRNSVVHAYKKIDYAVVVGVIATGLDDLVAFADSVMDYVESHPPA